MKGCTNEDQEDGSMKRRTFDIRLYWANNEKVTGMLFSFEILSIILIKTSNY